MRPTPPPRPVTNPQPTAKPDEEKTNMTIQAPDRAIRQQSIKMIARVPGASRVILHYRIKGDKRYRSRRMRRDNVDTDQWEGRVPGNNVNRPAVEYFVSARFGNETQIIPPDYEEVPFLIEIR